MPPTDSDYGSDRYIWQGGQRYKIGFTRSIVPYGAESRRDFEERMDTLALRLEQLPDVATFEIEIKIRKGLATEAVAHVTLAQPELAPIGTDDRPTQRPTRRGGGLARSRAADLPAA